MTRNDRRKNLSITRRGLMYGVGAGAGLALAPAFVRSVSADAHHTDSELFPLGVYSGDPSDNSVVIATRVAPDPLNGGGLTRRLEVQWQMATDPGMTRVVKRGRVTAQPRHGGSIKVVVEGLRADTWYYYRFEASGQSSRIGRTRTFPRANAACEQLTFALASCQDYRAGFYAAFRDVAAQQVDCVVHVGDYLYEDGSSASDLRQHTVGSGPGGEILTVDDYRNRYALYRLDEDLKAAHAAAPWLVTWDDHETDNNYAGDIAEIGAAVEGEAFLARKLAAYQVYGEVMPVRPDAELRGNGQVDLFRSLPFGDLAEFHMLDTRQFRTDQPCADGFQPVCGEESNAAATLLGPRQEQRLHRALRRSRTDWNLLAQQIMMTKWNLDALAGSPVEFVNMDAWDGYVAARQRLTDFIRAESPRNPVVLSGDIHASFAANVLQNFADPASVVAAEIVGTSIASSFIDDPAFRAAIKQVTLLRNPHIKFHEGAVRGYVLCEVTHDEFIANYKGVRDAADPASDVFDVAQAVVLNGTPGIFGAPSIYADPDAGIFP